MVHGVPDFGKLFCLFWLLLGAVGSWRCFMFDNHKLCLNQWEPHCRSFPPTHPTPFLTFARCSWWNTFGLEALIYSSKTNLLQQNPENQLEMKGIPSRELIYPLPKMAFWVDDFPFPVWWDMDSFPGGIIIFHFYPPMNSWMWTPSASLSFRCSPEWSRGWWLGMGVLSTEMFFFMHFEFFCLLSLLCIYDTLNWCDYHDM